MFTFLQPVWLWAAAAIILPVFIHLWNIKQGKILQVGSISLIDQSDRQQAKSRKLKDLLLLLVRCLLLIVLAMLLAKPQFTSPVNVQTEKGWIVMEKEGIPQHYNMFKSQVDSLTDAGYSFHYFEKGFKQMELSKALKDSSVRTNTNTANYWKLVRLLDQQVPDSFPVFLITSNNIVNFKGSRPAISMNLIWKTTAPVDSRADFPLAAYGSPKGNLNIEMARSQATSTTVSKQKYAWNSLPPAFETTDSANGFFLKYADSLNNRSAVPIDTSLLKVVIFADQYVKDADYVRAAVNAIRQHTNRSMNVVSAKNINEIPAVPDWLFWLSTNELPPSVQYKNALVYKKGTEQNAATWLRCDNENLFDKPVALLKTIEHKKLPSEETIWSDGFGEPVLTLVSNGSNTYNFYNRFNPDWNDLVWDQRFPEVIMKMLFKDEVAAINPLDKRIIDDGQLQPIRQITGSNFKPRFIKTTDLNHPFWVVAFVLFCLERLLSFYRKREVAYG